MATGAQPAPEEKKLGHGLFGFHRDGFGIPHSPFFKPGKFGRMFPRLDPLAATDQSVIALGAAMIETAEMAADPGLDNTPVPAGFTYLGQFVDHDITFDTTPMPEARVDPLAIHNFRTPKLDLDSVYGNGPGAQPYMYQRANPNLMLIGQNTPSADQAGVPIPALPNDLPRNPEGFALIGDPRNDENLIVAQLHLSFLKFHNQVVATRSLPFEEARRVVTWHYQWIVLHDFLPRLIDQAEIDRALAGRDYYTYSGEPFIPVEFSVAAYRFGHTMVREQYDHNRVFGPEGPPARLFFADLQTLFSFTGLSGTNVPVPSNWAIDWRRFFDFPGTPSNVRLNKSRKLDPLLTPALGNLPGPAANADMKKLSVRNLLRGLRMGLPSGQHVARALGLRRQMLTPDEIASGPDGAAARANGLDRATPLWYYILKEAQVRGGGSKLGPVGSRILAQVFVGLLEGDSKSFLSKDPDWKPDLPASIAGNFTMVDMLNFVGEVNPIG